MRARVLVLVTAFALASAAEAQTMRNPPDATPSPGTTRGPGAARNAAGADRGATQPGGAPTRPPLGSEPRNQADGAGRATTAPGHTLGVGPNSPGNNGTGLRGGSPGVTNPDAANGGASPAPLSGSRPNGGSAINGSKSSPMRANGVREVQ